MTSSENEVKAGSESQDEIDKILDEVEQLRKELNGPAVQSVINARLPSEPVEEEVSLEETLASLDQEGPPAESPAALPTVLAAEPSPLNAATLEVEKPESHPSPVLNEPKATIMKFPQSVSDSTNESVGQSDGAMHISLSGAMTLKLSYDFDGQSVTVGFSDDFLKIALADGTEFKIPVGKRVSSRPRKTG